MKAFDMLFGGRRHKPGPSLPDGYRLYAVGDIHGRDDLLGELLAIIERDMAERGPARLVLVFLGDLIDRGPDSRGVLERLRTYRSQAARTVFLTGNHEEVLLRILDGDAELIADWLRFGGAECLQSYGADPDHIRNLPLVEALAAVREAISASHVEFLKTFDDTFRAGDYLFVHAGIRPGVALTEQVAVDLRWIREPFLSDSADHGHVVVHGHTIREEVDERSNRIGIDTGAYRHGVLTAIGLEGTNRWFVQARSNGPVNYGLKPISSAVDVVSVQSG